MKKIFLLLISFCFINIISHANYSIIFIHLGKSIPTYVTYAIKQARLFNPKSNIYLLTDNKHLLSENIVPEAKIVSVNSLPISNYHKEFRKKTTLNRTSREGFWLHTSERFLVLHNFVEHMNLKHVFHMENDTILYANLEKLMPIFEKHYPYIGAVFDNDARCIPCFIYIKDKHASQNIASCFAKHAASGKNDMYMLGILKKEAPGIISNLPIITPGYINTVGLKSPSGHTTKIPYAYANHFDKFNSIFDGAALGQFLGGIDPRNGKSEPGFINESCLFNPSLLTFSWKTDNHGRAVPYASFGDKTCRINILHIHSKRLEKFLS